MKKTPAVIKPQAFLVLSVADIELFCKFIVKFGVFPLQRYRVIPVISDETVFAAAFIYQRTFFVINFIFKAEPYAVKLSQSYVDRKQVVIMQEIFKMSAG